MKRELDSLEAKLLAVFCRYLQRTDLFQFLVPCPRVSIVTQVDQLAYVVVVYTFQKLQGLCRRARDEITVVDEAKAPRLLPEHDCLDEEIMKGRVSRPWSPDRPHLKGPVEDRSPLLGKPNRAQTCQRTAQAVSEDLDAPHVCLHVAVNVGAG